MTTKKADYIWFNGEMVRWEDAKVHVMSHALHYGTSVFEGIRCYDSHKGPVVFRHREHMQRLHDSAKIYRFPVSQSIDELMEACRDVIRKNNLTSAYIRPLIFVGDVGMGVNPPARPLVASREMGTALQLVNIARDIKGDATEGRFYLPLSFFGLRDESKLAIPTDWTEPRPQDFDKLLSLSPSSTLPSSNASESFRFEWKTYSLPLVAYAEDLAKHSYKGIDRLPTELQAGMRAACASYLLIGREIKVVWKGDVGERRTVAGWRRVRKVLSVVMSGWEGQ